MKHIKTYKKYNEGIFSFLKKDKKEKITNDFIVESYLEILDTDQITCSLKKRNRFFLVQIPYTDFCKGFFADDFQDIATDFINKNVKEYKYYSADIYYPDEVYGYDMFHIEFNKNNIDYNFVLDLLQPSEDRILDSVSKLDYFLVVNKIYMGELEGPPEPEDRILDIPIKIKKKFKKVDELRLAISKYINENYRDYFSIYIRIKK